MPKTISAEDIYNQIKNVIASDFNQLGISVPSDDIMNEIISDAVTESMHLIVPRARSFAGMHGLIK